MDEADTRGYASCARASSGVFAGTEQHVGQFSEGGTFAKRKRYHREVWRRRLRRTDKQTDRT